MDLVVADTHSQQLWDSKATSSLTSHSSSCCKEAKSWLLGMSKSFEFSNLQCRQLIAPTWLNQYYEWGPSPWPLPWCEAVAARQIDCGVFAAFAKEIFKEQGHEAYSGQVIQQYDTQVLLHLKRKWEKSGYHPTWISRDCVYHEVCAVRVNADEVKVYDPTDSIWLDPERRSGPASVLSIRLELPLSLVWGPHKIFQDQWLDVV